MSDKVVNGQEYWDERFQQDWVQNQGRRQSEFFAIVACTLFPEWLVHDVTSRNATFCDWGCAMGDGTQLMKLRLGLQRVTGLDFSETAIRQAKEDYADIEFSTEDLLADQASRRFDIIFSSNTLEHFADPWTVANKLASLSDSYFAFLVPFQEPPEQRHEEHLYSFDWHNIRRSLGNGFTLVSVSTIDASQLPDTQWGGKQMLAVYARPEVLLRIGDEIAQSGGDLLGQYGRQHDDMEKLRTELTFTIKQRNELGFQLEAAKDAHDKAEKEHEKKALAAQQRIESYQREVDDQKQRLEMQAAQVDALQRESKALQDVWQRESLALQEALHVCQEALQQSKDEIAALRSEIQAVYASRSWRATAPLRAISRRIKN